MSLAVQPNGRTVAIASSDVGVQTLDASADRPAPVGQGNPQDGIGAMALSADGKLLVKLSGALGDP